MFESLAHWLHLNEYAHGDLLVILVLIVLEGLLSCDNAVVLAMVVKPLPPAQRGRALRYGIIGAYVFRVIALMLATWIMSQWVLKILGGAYLIWLAWRELSAGPEADDVDGTRKIRRFFGLSAFWCTVINVELTDIVFSVDSIAAAVALTDKLYVLIIGGFLGILAMRYAAQGFILLLERFPRLETAAMIAVAIIGIKLVAEFPVDVLAKPTAFAPGTVYATAADYDRVVREQYPPRAGIPHTLELRLSAPPRPDAAQMRSQLAQRNLTAEALDTTVVHEHTRASAAWSLRYRSFCDIEGWASSLLVFLIFCCGFLVRPRASSH
jgi:YkoY family integral membrane protein